MRLESDEGIAAHVEAREARDQSLLGEAYLAEGLREPSTSYSLRTANSPAAIRASARSARIEEESVGTTT